MTSENQRPRKKESQKTRRMDRQNPRTNGKSKAIQTKSHKEAYTYTLTKREKERKNIYKKNKRSEEHTSELQSHSDLVCRLLLEKKNIYIYKRKRATK